jgi:hypothetical protein|tara:strand:- start:899 stop:1072 length:174 start_codon:yes stop_codon:yes gene_type:complete
MKDKVWVVELEKTVSINIAIPKEKSITEEIAIALAFEGLSHEDKKNYEFKNIWTESV